MIALTAAQVAALAGGTLTLPDGVAAEDVVVTSVVTDSREVTPGALFVAIAGEHVDGHDHAAGAVAAGASLVLTERSLASSDSAPDTAPDTAPDGEPLPSVQVADSVRALGELARGVLARLRERPEGAPRVLAMTGSVGKTTTKDLLAQVFAADGPTVAPVRSFNNEVGLPVTVLRCTEETRTLVLEMGADAPGNIDYLTAIAPPDVAAVLVVGSAHLAGMGGIDGVAHEKAAIVRGLRPDGTAVLNADDPRVAAMAEQAPGAVLTFGRSADADVRATDVTAGGARASFTLHHGGRTAPVTLRLVGEHHVTNALAAAATAIAAGLSLDVVARRLSQADAASPHRMAVTELADGVTLVDDSYNANPDSMRAALKALVAIGAGRRTVAVLGEMLELGEVALTEHDALGRLAVRLDVSRLLVVGRGARAMYTGALLEGSFGEEAAFAEDVEEARAWLRREVLPGDVVLVKSSNGAGLYRLADALVAEGSVRGSRDGSAAGAASAAHADQRAGQQVDA